MNILGRKKINPLPTKKSNDILMNIIRLGSESKKYNKILRTIGLYIAGKILHQKIKTTFNSADTSSPRGFNNYWSSIVADYILDLNNQQRSIIEREFSMHLNSVLNESVDIPEDLNSKEYEAEYEGFLKLFGNKSNLVELEGGIKLGALNVDIPAVEKFAYTLRYHANKTTNVHDFIDSVNHFVNNKDYILSQYDVELLTIHYERYK